MGLFWEDISKVDCIELMNSDDYLKKSGYSWSVGVNFSLSKLLVLYAINLFTKEILVSCALGFHISYFSLQGQLQKEF